jgi:propionyl-CoA carboxylase alpha chain
MTAVHRPITRVLVANRGEIARRVFATCREQGISTAAVFSEPDADAPFVAEADVAVALGGATPAESYLRADALLDAARRVGADAIHPGYGFLAENAGFAQAVIDAGLVWIGPSPEAIAAMGSKTEARSRMEAAGVPVLPGVTLTGDEDDDALRAAAERVGYPLLVKASAGGGGKGMRLVGASDELLDGVAGARREAASAFGDDTVFLERYAPRSRHVEIQIMGDTHGTVVALHERDCSVQRRHQKVIEEAPSPVVDEGMRARMAAAAVAAGEAIGYVGAGTVEFLVIADAAEFFFLEVNTRLQVEHPVTELVTGLDLVALQLAVAEGAPLPPEALDPPLRGWAMEARLYAEDAANGFLPVTGTLTRFAVPEGVRVDTGVRDGSVISPYYDPMVAKVCAWGVTRAQAARRLADALARAEIHGTVTNRDFLVRVLRHPEFLAGEADTGFLERHDAAEMAAPLLDAEAERLCAAAAALAGAAVRRASATVAGRMPSGFRNNPSQHQAATFSGAHAEEIAVGYRFARDGRTLAVLALDGEDVEAPRLHACTADCVDLEAGGVRRTYRVHAVGAPGGDGGEVVVSTADGEVALRELPRFPGGEDEALAGSLTSPMPGTVIRVLAEVGAQVAKGAPLVVLEAMKMEHEIVAPADGVVAEVRVESGAAVDAGAVLVVLEAPE